MQKTKFNKANKIALAVLTGILLALTSIFFAGCNANFAELTSAAEKAAKTYYANHTYYENFADVSFTSKITSIEKQIVEIEYQKNPGDASMTKGSFTNSNNYSCQAVMSFKNVSYGDGAAEVKDVAVNFTIVATETEKTNVLNNDQKVVEQTSVSTKTTVYNIAPVYAASNNAYFITKTVTRQENDAQPEVTKNYFEFESRDDYIEAVENIIDYLNYYGVEVNFFDIFGNGEYASMMMTMMNITKGGNSVKAEYKNAGFFLGEDYEVVSESFIASVSFTNNKLGSAISNTKYSTEEFAVDTKTEISISDGAKNQPSIVDSFDGYTEIVDLDINDSDMELFRLNMMN